MCRTYRVKPIGKPHHKNAIPYSRTEKHKSEYYDTDEYKRK